jgi:ferredoxin
MQYLMTLYAALLFLVLVPGLFITIPRKGNKKVQVLVHALIFAVVYYLTENMVSKFLYEGFAPPTAAERQAAAKARAAAAKAAKQEAAIAALKANEQILAEAKKNGLDKGSECLRDHDCKSLRCWNVDIQQGTTLTKGLRCQ